MAAAHICANYGADEFAWKALLLRADDLAKRDSPGDIRGFLLAVRDCCVHVPAVPEWLESALLKRANYDLPAQAESRRARQLHFFVRWLENDDEYEKLEAIRNIEKGGYVDAEAKAALIDAVMFSQPSVRAAAIYAPVPAELP